MLAFEALTWLFLTAPMNGSSFDCLTLSTRLRLVKRSYCDLLCSWLSSLEGSSLSLKFASGWYLASMSACSPMC